MIFSRNKKLVWEKMTALSTSRCSTALASALIVVVSSLSAVSIPAYAEDIEIYANLIDNPLAQGAPNINQPNVLFILDTSGSMRSLLASTDRPAYDPSVDYGNSPNNTVYIYTPDLTFTQVSVPNNRNFCNSEAEFFAANSDFPEFTDRVAVWERRDATTAGWVSDEVNPDVANILGLECQTDNGEHGRNATARGVYPAQLNPNNPRFDRANYTGNANSPRNIDWQTPAFPNRVLVRGNYHDYLSLNPVQVNNLNNGAPLNNIPSDAIRLSYAGATPATLELINAQATAQCASLDRDDNVDRVVIVEDIPDLADQTFTCQSRLMVLQNSVNGLLRTISAVNIGLMRFNRNNSGTNNGGTLLNRVVDIDGNNGQNRLGLINEVNNLVASGFTPLEETLFEGYNYFAGRAPAFGNAELRVSDGSGGLDDDTSSDVRDSQSVSNGSYISPIESQCQDNSIVLFTDGAPTQDDDAQSNIINTLGITPVRSVVGGFSDDVCPGEGFDIDGVSTDNDNLFFDHGSCLDEIAAFMSAEDARVNTDIDDINRVYTYTISFGAPAGSVRSNFLRDVANAGLRTGADNDSQNFDANDSNALTSAFRSIIQDISEVEGDSFITPAVPVNNFTRLESNEEVYFSLFEPSNSPRWDGNLKSYRFDVIAGSVVIVDADGNPAVDAATGNFVDDARSVWSDDDDGNNVTQGGFANELDVTETDRRRELFLSLDSNSTTLERLVTDPNPDPSNPATPAIDRIVDIANGANNNLGDGDDISFGASPATDENNLRAIAGWTLGRDVTDERGLGANEANFYVGDSLHSTPIVVNFGDGQDVNDSVIFAATNQGMIHAIEANPNSGQELWAYVPDPGLLENLGIYFNNPPSGTIPHQYGIDGGFAIDEERDPETNQFISANLFVGQRRGGSKYFAFNVNNSAPSGSSGTLPVTATPPVAPPTTPVVSGQPLTKLWTLEDLPRMGESWATPIPATVNYCENGTCAPRDVLFISGGYDMAYDQESTPLATLSGTVNGNAIYMIDNQDSDNDGVLDSDVIETAGARAGQPRLLWMAGATSGQVDNSSRDFVDAEMTHAFPSPPAVIDVDADGVVDLLFAVDIAGRIWRIDFQGSVGQDNNGQIVFDENDIDSQNNNATNDREVNGGIIADLSENNINRRFYNTPSVSFSPRSETDFARFNIALGSGYRAHPTRDEGATGNESAGARNRLYVVFDRNISFPQLTFDSNGEPDGITYDIDDDGTRINSGDISAVASTTGDLNTLGVNRNGLFIDLENTRQKIIDPVITTGSQVIGTSYEPETAQTLIGSNVVCEQGLGSGSAFQLDLTTGNFESLPLVSRGLPGGASIVSFFDEDNDERVEGVLIGPELFDIEDPDRDGDTLERDRQFDIRRRSPGDIDKLFWLEREK